MTHERLSHAPLELRWLLSLASPSPRDPQARRRLHMGVPLAAPTRALAGLLALPVGLGVLQHTPLPVPSQPLDRPVRLVLAALAIYAVWFGLTLIWRTLICDWKRICADDLAFMVGHPDFRAWLEATPGAQRVRSQAGPLWDDPAYRQGYALDQGQVRRVDLVSDAERLRQALRDVLGHKQDGVFQPVRYLANLRQRKQSVSAFVKAHAAELERSRAGTLEPAEARLLVERLQAEMLPDSAGARYLREVLASLGTLPKGVVEVQIWARDPWTDLTTSREFFSSASLRGASWTESLERRTKGMLGPFGYLRNPSISALDFRTSEGRSLRARLGAARVGSARVLFVDAVEGRFDIKPRLIQQALEDYGRAAGFDWLICHGFPLNRVPRRFVQALARSGAEPVWVDLNYLEAGSREYLDAFGLPLEPLEYAHPRGRVFGYAVPLRPDVPLARARPQAWLPLARRALLPGILVTTLLVLTWMLLRTVPALLLPACLSVGIALTWERRTR